jgi:hypothetical protein
MKGHRSARLARSHADRNELGRRTEDGEPGKESANRLDALPGAQESLQEGFAGRPMTEQNHSEWKPGGCPDWLLREETRSLVSKLAQQSESRPKRVSRPVRLAESLPQTNPCPPRSVPIQLNQTKSNQIKPKILTSRPPARQCCS